MNRRSFSLMAGSAALSPFMFPDSSLAFREKQFTIIYDRNIILPSPLSYEIQTCSLIRQKIKDISAYDVLERSGVSKAVTIDAVRQSTWAGIEKNIGTAVNEAAQLRNEIDKISSKDAAEKLEAIQAGIALALAGLFVITGGSLALYGGLALTAYGAGKFAYQVHYRDPEALETITFVTSTRNGLLSVVPVLAKQKVPHALEVYSLANEAIMFAISSSVMYYNYRLRSTKKKELLDNLNRVSVKLAELRNILSKYFSNNTDFRSLLEICKQTTIDGLTAYSATIDGGACHLRSRIDALDFFNKFDVSEYNKVRGL